MSEVIINSETGLQRIIVTRTGAGVSIAAYGKKGGRSSVHIFEECIPELIEALKRTAPSGQHRDSMDRFNLT